MNSKKPTGDLIVGVDLASPSTSHMHVETVVHSERGIEFYRKHPVEFIQDVVFRNDPPIILEEASSIKDETWEKINEAFDSGKIYFPKNIARMLTEPERRFLRGDKEDSFKIIVPNIQA
jgi:hypothetical protein